MKSRQKLALTTAAPAPKLTRERAALSDLVHFCLTHDARALGAVVDHPELTREFLAHLRRWFDNYEHALPPRVQ